MKGFSVAYELAVESPELSVLSAPPTQIRLRRPLTAEINRAAGEGHQQRLVAALENKIAALA